MKGFISKSAAALCLTGGLVGGGGCVSSRDLVDPCWPERYNYTARKEVCEAFSPQVHNGRIIDQTMWAYYFEPNKPTLTPEGREHLKWILQRRPCPDTTIYLARANELGVAALGVSNDLVYDPVAPEKFAERCCELDMLRQQEIQKYLTAQTGGRGDCFTIVVHNPSEIPIHGLRSAGVVTNGNTGVIQPLGVSTSTIGALTPGGGTGGGAGGGGR